MDSRWGLTTIKTSEIFGEHTCAKIASVQALIIVVLLLLIQPKIVRQHQNNYSQIDMFKILTITCIIVIATYFLPLFIRN